MSFGTYVGHHSDPFRLAQVPKGSPLLAPARLPRLSEGVLEAIGNFASLCDQIGAICCYSFPPHPEELVGNEATRILNRLQTIPKLRILDTPLEQSYPLSSFYDTRYHLTKAGAEERSRRIILGLQRLHSRSGSTAASADHIVLIRRR
jgi:hypothetical protein